MIKTRFRKLCQAGAGTVFFMGICAHSATAQSPRPNIIMFLVDDMGWEDTSVPFWTSETPANHKFYTPNMERLAALGMKFTDAHAASVCTPSRVSLMSGMNAAHHRVTNWTMLRDQAVDEPDSILSAPAWNVNGLSPKAGIARSVYVTPLPALLHKAGYFTIHCGKAHFGAYQTPGADPLNLGFDINIAGSAAGNPASYLAEDDFGNVPGKFNLRAVPGLNEYWGSKTFLTEALTQRAMRAIDTAEARKQPFFLYMAHFAVHIPYDADSRFFDKYRRMGLEPSEAAYAALVEGMDKSLGDLMHYLDVHGLTRNTIILFMSDNGGLSHAPRSGKTDTQNFPLRAGKASLYEGGTREPMIVDWPGVTPPGSVNAQYLMIEDFFPTILQMAGVRQYHTVQEIDGKSFVPLLKGEHAPDTTRTLIWNFPNKWIASENNAIAWVSAIRQGDWKLLYFQKTGKRELYNIREDIGEHTDLAGSYPAKVNQLALLLTIQLKRWQAQMPVVKQTGRPVPWPDSTKDPGSNGVVQRQDLRGPILSDQFTVNASREGVFATDVRYEPSSGLAINARPSGSVPDARWIWIDPIRYPDLQNTGTTWIGQRKEDGPYVVNFKKTFDIGDDVDHADIKLSADLQYRLFINGRLAGRGPANIGSDYADHQSPLHWFYDQFDSRHAFKKGKNVIAIEVSTLDKTPSVTTMGRGGLIVDVEIKLKSGKHIHIGTDAAWMCEPSKNYLPGAVVDATGRSADASGGTSAPGETFDWYTEPAYGKDWIPAVILPDSISAKWKLRQSQLPQMMEKRIFPAKISKEGIDATSVTGRYPLIIGASNTPQKITLEFDNLYTGYLGLKVTGRAGTKLDITIGETPGSGSNRIVYILRDGSQTFEFPHLVDGKYVNVTVTNPDGNLTINDLSIDYSSFPVSYTGDFSCSDGFLNALWGNIRWITQMNMQTYHMDSPLHQEPVSDAGDYLIESLVNYYTFSSPLLIKQDLRKIGLVLEKTGYKMFHTSYMLLWVQMLVHYYEYTGDKELLKELAPDVYKLLDRFHSYIGAPGIITDAPNYMFMDWGDFYSFELHHPPASLGQGYMTAFYYKGLTEGKKIAGYLGDDRKSAQLSVEARDLKTAFIDRLYDKQTRLFKSGLFGTTTVKPYSWLPKDTSIDHNLPYVNTLALLYGLAPADAENDILQYVLTQKDVTISPYFMFFVFEAIAKADAFNRYGFDQLRRWKQLSQYPVGLKEGWTMGDYSHAWGGSPAYELSSKVLGVSPLRPGFKQVLIAPNPGDLTWARGVVSTPDGKIMVNWQHTSKGFFIQAKNPLNMPVTFRLPLDKGTIILVNGKKRTVGNNGEIKTIGGNNTISVKAYP